MDGISKTNETNENIDEKKIDAIDMEIKNEDEHINYNGLVEEYKDKNEEPQKQLEKHVYKNGAVEEHKDKNEEPQKRLEKHVYKNGSVKEYNDKYEEPQIHLKQHFSEQNCVGKQKIEHIDTNETLTDKSLEAESTSIEDETGDTKDEENVSSDYFDATNNIDREIKKPRCCVAEFPFGKIRKILEQDVTKTKEINAEKIQKTSEVLKELFYMFLDKCFKKMKSKNRKTLFVEDLKDVIDENVEFAFLRYVFDSTQD